MSRTLSLNCLSASHSVWPRSAKILTSLISLGAYASLTAPCAWAHGGVPQILSIQRGPERLTVLDTLGLFEAPLSSPISDPLRLGSTLGWLCDDAVDMTAGIDAAVRLDEQTLIVVARSGVYRSEDNGCSFTALSEPLSLHSVSQLSAHPERAEEVVAVSHTLGRENDAFFSADQGRSWRAAGLNISGGIYALWRNPDAPDELWVSHAEGLSVSQDGGQTFSADPLLTEPALGLSAEETAALVSRPQALTVLGGGRVSAGPLSGQRVIWMSVNLYPTSTLLRRVDEGPWVPVHQLEDSYESLALSGSHVVVSTTFQGLLRRRLSGEGEGEAWGGQAELSVGCLYASGGELWACGRGDTKSWLVGLSRDEGAQWEPVWGEYLEAAGARWECPAQAESVVACEARCLDEGCDPSGLMGGDMITEPSAGDAASPSETMPRRPSDEGCQGVEVRPMSAALLTLLLCLLASRARRSSPPQA